MRTRHYAGPRPAWFASLNSASILLMAIAALGVASAQAAGAAGERGVEAVVVTGSRAITNGAEAPTPVQFAPGGSSRPSERFA